MKILLTGAAGQLGTELYPRLAALGSVVAVDLDHRNSQVESCQSLDLGNAAALETFLNRTQPDLIVNAAAFTAVDRAEENPELAFLVNAQAPGRMARWALNNDCKVLHYSTDYVFDGDAGQPYRESHQASPMNVYGESKLAGEHAIVASGCSHAIIRTSWVYSSHGSNFVLNMLKLARRQLQLSVVNDQVGCPTWARNLAEVSVKVLSSRKALTAGGAGQIFHYCDADALSWYDFASLVFGIAVELHLLDQAPALKSVRSDEYPQLAKRPRYSVLDTSRIRALGIRPAGLQQSIRTCLEELRANEQ